MRQKKKKKKWEDKQEEEEEKKKRKKKVKSGKRYQKSWYGKGFLKYQKAKSV